MNDEAAFFDLSSHFESLARLASSRLESGDGASAYKFADRRCRYVTPSARDFLLRAEASRLSGRSDYALRDLARALEIDPTDIFVSHSVMKWGPEIERRQAAMRLIGHSAAEPQILLRAVETLQDLGDRIVLSLKRIPGGIGGWVAWVGLEAVQIHFLRDGAESSYTLLPDPSHPLAEGPLSGENLFIEDDDSTISELTFLIRGEIVEKLSIPPTSAISSSFAKSARRLDPPQSSPPELISVIVPMYDDYEASRNCLQSLQQKSSIHTRIIVVDDHSPNEELRSYLEKLELEKKVVLIKNEINMGFAAWVNRALDCCDAGDVLLVNSDAILPPGAIDQLATAAYSDAAIGTVTPFSNNGEFAGYPKPNQVSPMPSVEEIARINERAAAAHGSAVVDMPNGIGFCLYVKEAGLSSVGNLSDLYSRGYFEDVDFCLKAKQKGFRNVCATGVFVGHAGSLSFRAEKRSLVVRNRAIIEARFPDYRKHCEAYVKADPLKSARAAIEFSSPPSRNTVLICSGAGHSRAIAKMQFEQISSHESDLLVLHCAYDVLGKTVALSGPQQDAPQSLSFTLDEGEGAAGLRDYLGRLKLVRIEILDAGSTPQNLLIELLASDAIVELLCADLQWFNDPMIRSEGRCRDPQTVAPCAHCLLTTLPAHKNFAELTVRQSRILTAVKRADAIRPADRIAEIVSKRIFKDRTLASVMNEQEHATGNSNLSGTALGVLVPSRAAVIDQQIIALGRQFARSQIPVQIVVFGQCVDDLALMSSGNVFVVGQIEEGEFERLLDQYEIGALMLPYRTCFFGLVDRIAAKARLPKAYFDWSFGSLGVNSGDLSMDPRICDAKAAVAVANWRRSAR